MKVKYGNLTKNIKYVVSKINCGNEVTILLRVNVGSRDEPDSMKGISHLLEHMFFRGTEKYPTQKDLTVELYKCGGDFNAYTEKDSTVFHVTVSKKCIEKGIEILSESYYNSLFRDEDLKKEKKIVINEINDNLSEPSTLMLYGLDELVFQKTRLEKDIAGTVETVSSLNIFNLKNFINTYYVKDVVVSVSGNIDLNNTISLVKKYFNKNVYYDVKKDVKIIKDKKRILYYDYYKQKTVFRDKYIKKNVEQSFIGIGFSSYEYKDDKRYIMGIISEVLTGYLGSKLYERLRGKNGLVYDVSIGTENYIDLSQISVTCSTENKKENILKCIVIILEELNALKYDTITDEEFNASISNIVENIKNEKNNNEYLADKFAEDLIYNGEPVLLDEYIHKFNSFTKEDIIVVAKELFTKNKCKICYTGKDKMILK